MPVFDSQRFLLRGTMTFYQSSPVIPHPFQSDTLLQKILRWGIPESERASIESDISRFGDDILSKIEKLACQAEAIAPIHIPFDPWGKRIDHLELSSAWQELQTMAAREGLISIGYSGERGPTSRLHQFAKIYLFHPSSAFVTCPLAMTDGAAKLIETMKGSISSEVERELEKAFAYLTESNPSRFCTSGQWMTERTGGSDVGRGETLARPVKGSKDSFQLFGTKWFASATNSEMVFTLAKVEGEKAPSLFFLPTRKSDRLVPGIEISRLKDKLGTRALPTAEIELKGAEALLVGERGKGVKNISHMFNVTRIYNACTSVATGRRLLNLSLDYAQKRIAFGRPIIEHPLHAKVLQEMESILEIDTALTFYTVLLLGRSEQKGERDKERDLRTLRLLTPVAKLTTAKHAMMIVSELLESFGGAGYVEDTGIPKFLRDTQVFSIWEGTTNVLALDALRAIERDNSLPIFFESMRDLLGEYQQEKKREEMERQLHDLEKKIADRQKNSTKWVENARELTFSLGDIAGKIVLELIHQVD